MAPRSVVLGPCMVSHVFPPVVPVSSPIQGAMRGGEDSPRVGPAEGGGIG